MATPTPQERLVLAEKHAALLRALLSHPAMAVDANGVADPANIPATLFFATDFEVNTYRNYLMPLLPPDATTSRRSLVVFPVTEEGAATYRENPSAMADELYPRMQVGGFMEKYMDVISRGIMPGMIIQNRAQQMLVGGPFEFGDEIIAAARALTHDD